MNTALQLCKLQRPGNGAKQFSCMIVMLVAFLFSACSAAEAPPTAVEVPPTANLAGSCSLGLAQGVSDQEAIEKVLRSEGEFVVAQQIDPLMALWAEESSVVDAHHTAATDTDDQLWTGKDAIRHRYVRVVFPGAPTEITPSDLQVQIDGEAATVIASTHIGNEVSKAGDRWQLIRQDGCWLIQNLTYNLEEQK